MTKNRLEIQIYKYVVHNVAHRASVRPRPLCQNRCSAITVPVCTAASGEERLYILATYAGLSGFKRFASSAASSNAKAINATGEPDHNSTTSGPGLRSAGDNWPTPPVTVPPPSVFRWWRAPARRIEVRFPDPAANPYLCFAALLMASVWTGSIRSPGEAMDKNLYDLPPEAKEITGGGFSGRSAERAGHGRVPESRRRVHPDKRSMRILCVAKKMFAMRMTPHPVGLSCTTAFNRILKSDKFLAFAAGQQLRAHRGIDSDVTG